MKTGTNLFLRQDGRWEARYQKGRNENGKLIYGFVYGATREEAELKRAEALRKLYSNADDSTSELASLNPNVTSLYQKNKKTGNQRKLASPLGNETAEILEEILLKSQNSAAFAFLLSLHMGLSSEETIALAYNDIDFDKQQITVSKKATSVQRKLVLAEADGRTLPIPKLLQQYMAEHRIVDKEKKFFVFNDSPELAESARSFETAFRRFLKENGIAEKIPAGALSSTFVRRCLDANMNIESVSAITGLEKSRIYRFFGKYIKPDVNALKRLDSNFQQKENGNKHLNLLILGAGSHGSGVKETAEMLGVFQKIRFLDDTVINKNVVGKCSDYRMFLNEYPAAFVAFGDNTLRKEWMNRLREAGYLLPRLIHPSSTLSDDVEIGDGSIVMSQVTVSSGAVIGNGCILASNSMVGFGAEIGDYSHIDCGGIVMKNAAVPEKQIVKSGTVFENDKAAV